jgi:hypothetical protein
MILTRFGGDYAERSDLQARFSVDVLLANVISENTPGATDTRPHVRLWLGSHDP